MSTNESRIKVIRKERDKRKPATKSINISSERDEIVESLKDALGFSTKSSVYEQLFEQLFEKYKGLELTNPRTGTTFIIQSSLAEITSADLASLISQAMKEELKQEADKEERKGRRGSLEVGEKEVVKEKNFDPKSMDDF